MKILSPAVAVALVAATAFAAQSIPPDLRETALAIFKPLPSIPAVTNPSTPEKIALGKALFFDPRLSSSGVFSFAAQRSNHRAILSFRQGLGPERGRRNHGHHPAWRRTNAKGNRSAGCLSSFADREAVGENIPHLAD